MKPTNFHVLYDQSTGRIHETMRFFQLDENKLSQVRMCSRANMKKVEAKDEEGHDFMYKTISVYTKSNFQEERE